MATSTIIYNGLYLNTVILSSVKVILNVNEVFIILTMPKINIFACYQNQ